MAGIRDYWITGSFDHYARCRGSYSRNWTIRAYYQGGYREGSEQVPGKYQADSSYVSPIFETQLG
jgi:hypothetical protein